MRATIVEAAADKKTVYKVMLGGHEVGTSKTGFDAQFHANAINDALDVAFLEGQKYLERLVEKQRIDLEIQQETLKTKAAVEQERAAITQVGEHWR